MFKLFGWFMKKNKKNNGKLGIEAVTEGAEVTVQLSEVAQTLRGQKKMLSDLIVELKEFKREAQMMVDEQEKADGK